jgi:hypothetical protein
LSAEDRELIQNVRQNGSHHKNISHKPQQGKVSGLDEAAAPREGGCVLFCGATRNRPLRAPRAFCRDTPVRHAVESGQFAMEQRPIIPPDALAAPERVPIAILEKLAGRSSRLEATRRFPAGDGGAKIRAGINTCINCGGSP